MKELVPTESQLRGMIKFATRAEKAYRELGQPKNAERAKAHRERLEKELKERFGK